MARKGLFDDYVIDLGFSILSWITGGIIGFNLFDWIAAILIYRREKDALGRKWALLLAWEAVNLFPLDLIPVFGWFLDVFLAFFPAVTIARKLVKR